MTFGETPDISQLKALRLTLSVETNVFLTQPINFDCVFSSMSELGFSFGYPPLDHAQREVSKWLAGSKCPKTKKGHQLWSEFARQIFRESFPCRPLFCNRLQRGAIEANQAWFASVANFVNRGKWSVHHHDSSTRGHQSYSLRPIKKPQANLLKAHSRVSFGSFFVGLGSKYVHLCILQSMVLYCSAWPESYATVMYWPFQSCLQLPCLPSDHFLCIHKPHHTSETKRQGAQEWH